MINRINQCLRLFGMPWSPEFVLGLEVVFENGMSDHEMWSIWCHVGVHVDFTSILHSYTPLIPRAECDANSDRLHLFYQWESLKFNDHGLSISCVKWSWGPVTITLQALSWWKRWSRSKFASHYARGTNIVSKCKTGVESTWSPTRHQMDCVPCHGLFSKTT